MILLIYSIYISVDLAHHELFCAKVVKGGIKLQMQCLSFRNTYHLYLHSVDHQY